MNVSCVIVTRGDCDLSPVLETLDWFDDIIVWNNAEREDLGLYGRYAAIAEAKHDIIVTQDDDVRVTCWPQLLLAYQPGVLTVNYPEPWDIPWVARGAIFDRELPAAAFARYFAAGWPDDDLFQRYICDAVFGLLTPFRVVDYGSQDLPHAFRDGRISTSKGWYDNARPAAKARCEMILEAAA